jgi:glycosyltransferase involved in cell wall biosynthesis
MVGGVTRPDIEQELQLPMPHNTRLLPTLSHAETLDAVAAAGAIVVTSFREGLPTLVLEAMAMQRQLIVPSEAGCLDATDGDRHALVYHHGNLEEMQELTLRSLTTPICRQAARSRILTDFDWNVVAARLDSVYQGMNS